LEEEAPVVNPVDSMLVYSKEHLALHRLGFPTPRPWLRRTWRRPGDSLKENNPHMISTWSWSDIIKTRGLEKHS